MEIKKYISLDGLRAYTTEVLEYIRNATHSHSNKDILDATTASFTTELQTKLDGVEEGATKTTVDSVLSETSTNPVQNKVVNEALSNKSEINHTHSVLIKGGATAAAVSVGEDGTAELNVTNVSTSVLAVPDGDTLVLDGNF